MKYLTHIILGAGFILLSGFTPGDRQQKNISHSVDTPVNQGNTIHWTDFETAAIESGKSNKMYFIYVYTDWCGYCKKLTSTTFKDSDVIDLLNEKFHSVKFNAESKEIVSFKGNEFKFVANGRRGYHELAAALTNNRLSYPTLVFLDENMNMIQPLPGYKSAEDLSIILKFLGNRIYEQMTFDDYYKQQTEG